MVLELSERDRDLGDELATVDRVVGAAEPFAEIVIASRTERMLVAIEVDLLVTSDEGELAAPVAIAIGHATDTSHPRMYLKPTEEVNEGS